MEGHYNDILLGRYLRGCVVLGGIAKATCLPALRTDRPSERPTKEVTELDSIRTVHALPQRIKVTNRLTSHAIVADDPLYVFHLIIVCLCDRIANHSSSSGGGGGGSVLSSFFFHLQVFL